MLRCNTGQDTSKSSCRMGEWWEAVLILTQMDLSSCEEGLLDPNTDADFDLKRDFKNYIKFQIIQSHNKVKDYTSLMKLRIQKR